MDFTTNILQFCKSIADRKTLTIAFVIKINAT